MPKLYWLQRNDQWLGFLTGSDAKLAAKRLKIKSPVISYCERPKAKGKRPALTKPCKNAKTYQPIEQPTCGCTSCIGRWQKEQKARIKRANERVR